MAKDAWKNQPNYKIGGGQLNEYEFNQQHGALTEQEHSHLPGQPQGLAGEAATDATPTEGDTNESPEARRIRELMESVHEKVARRGGGQKGAGAKKPGASKSAKKSGASKKAAKKSPAKGAAKKSAKKSASKGAKKSAAKAGAKPGAKKSGAGRGAAKKSSGAKKSAKSSAAAKGAKKRGARGR